MRRLLMEMKREDEVTVVGLTEAVVGRGDLHVVTTGLRGAGKEGARGNVFEITEIFTFILIERKAGGLPS